jgi:hypothetical protein
MKIKLINVTEGACMNFTLPNGDQFLMSEGVTIDAQDAVAAWLVDNYTTYITTVSTDPASEPDTKE